MALTDKARCDSDTETHTAEEECRPNRNNENVSEGPTNVQLLANEGELLDSDTEVLSTTDSNCALELEGDNAFLSTVREDCKSVVGSPPHYLPSLLENYKTPHSQRRVAKQQTKKEEDELSTGSNFLLDEKNQRQIPAVIKKWPACVEVWLNILYKEEATLRARNARNSNTSSPLLPRMRAILVDWIMEVCEVYQLRRNTYYLALDYMDRYLAYRNSIPKTQLQMVGVTCLFIAAKLEEIYPPKLSEFAYVCDGACTEMQMLMCELLVLSALGWDVNPMTPTTWLNLYMQIEATPSVIPPQLQQQYAGHVEIYYPTYSAYDFVRANNVIDLFSFDPSYSRFSYNVIAAAAMNLVLGEEIALNASGLKRHHLDLCLAHMMFFYKVLNTADNPRLLSVLGNGGGGACSTGIPHSVAFIPIDSTYSPATNAVSTVDNNQLASYRSIRAAVPDLVRDENHTMQTHCIDLDYYERAVILRLEWLGFDVKKVYSKQRKSQEAEPSAATEPLTSSPCKNSASDSATASENHNGSSPSEADGENVQVRYEDESGDENNDDDEDSESTSTTIMYEIIRTNEIEGINCLNYVVPRKDLTKKATARDVNDDDKKQETNIFALQTCERQHVTFDEILTSVHRDCTDKMVLSLWRQYNSSRKK